MQEKYEDEPRKSLFDTEMLPDFNSAEAVRYGSAYRFVKNADWLWSAIEDYLRRKARGLESQIMDRNFAHSVLKDNRYVIFSPTPPFSSPRQIRDVFTLRDLVRVQSALNRLDHFREMNHMWARKQAIDEYVKTLLKDGTLTAEDWKTCTSEFNMEPITYEFTHGTANELGPEENVDWNDFVQALYGKEKEHREEEGSGFHLDIPPLDEEQEEEQMGTDPLLEEMRELVSRYVENPTLDALSVLEDRNEEKETVIDWLDGSLWDPMGEIQYLISCAEALP